MAFTANPAVCRWRTQPEQQPGRMALIQFRQSDAVAPARRSQQHSVAGNGQFGIGHANDCGAWQDGSHGKYPTPNVRRVRIIEGCRWINCINHLTCFRSHSLCRKQRPERFTEKVQGIRECPSLSIRPIPGGGLPASALD